MPSYQYTSRDEAWFAQRTLRRHAGVFHLWALGVGAVISGDFFGWNFGFTAGGFGGLIAALLIMTVLYIGLCFSLAELSPALPHTGGAYSFARTTMGPWGGYLTGLAENMEYIFTPATIVYSATAAQFALADLPLQRRQAKAPAPPRQTLALQGWRGRFRRRGSNFATTSLIPYQSDEVTRLIFTEES